MAVMLELLGFHYLIMHHSILLFVNRKIIIVIHTDYSKLQTDTYHLDNAGTLNYLFNLLSSIFVISHLFYLNIHYIPHHTSLLVFNFYYKQLLRLLIYLPFSLHFISSSIFMPIHNHFKLSLVFLNVLLVNICWCRFLCCCYCKCFFSLYSLKKFSGRNETSSWLGFCFSHLKIIILLCFNFHHFCGEVRLRSTVCSFDGGVFYCVTAFKTFFFKKIFQ